MHTSGPATSLSRRTVLRTALLAGAAVAAPGTLAACAPQTQPATAGGLIRVGWKSDMDTFNPITTATTEAIEIQQLIYDTLMEYGLDLKPEPGLATAAKAEGNTITYTLRDGVTWHDGTPEGHAKMEARRAAAHGK